MNRRYGISVVALAAATCILFPRTATAELAFAGAGSQQLQLRQFQRHSRTGLRAKPSYHAHVFVDSRVHVRLSWLSTFGAEYHFFRSRGRVAGSTVGIHRVLLSITSV